MTQANNSAVTIPAFLEGGGEMGELMRSINWSATSLGDPAFWPSALKQMVSMMLTVNFPVLVCWGSDYIQLYNDSFRPINGATKHPQAMAGSAKDTYAEIWETIGPMFAEVMTGKTIGFPDFMVPMDRNGYTEECYFDFSYSPIRTEDGSVGGVLVVCLETTGKVVSIERQNAINDELASANEELAATNEELLAVNDELAAINVELTESQKILKRNERLFRSIAVNIPDSVIVVIDREHRYVMVEGDLMEKMGYQRTDYEGRHPTEIGQTERYNASKHLYDRMMAGERFSLERKGQNGEYYRVYLVPLKNEQGEVDAGLVMAMDISNIKQAEEKSAKLAAIVESSDDAIISKTLESVITSWNDAAQRMFGYTAGEIIGETIYKLIPPDRQDEEPRILARLKAGERVEHFETKRMTKAGNLIDVSLTISPIKDPQGNIIGVSKIARDITERKLDETRKNDFIGMASHELKTPLTSLNAIIQVAGMRLKDNQDTFLSGAMDRANTQVKKMTRMINGFLNISRLEAGKLHIEKDPFDLNELLLGIFQETQMIVNTHGVSLHTTGKLNVCADRDKIDSVISNLITNAVKYSPKGKEIRIGSETRGDNAIVWVKDEGIGIGPNDLKQIFDRYHRVESEDTRHISGFGIGLYLSAEIIGRHDGKIWAESEPGGGSTFYFSLPLA
ncbi:PAS domain S-box protein [Mucilaginibacter ginsenosidivorans]|uniref:histidine kinase n=1 Tax=Mucilaginibacter ginsenosidivorans TaxID=398053 RepID=A0A5B8UZT7_9SPHI|nr:PAS domain S-box protein [Mucilaginibacter ginsenosidivorans]QEC64700.1 PAS domain S-box protein [Mucilaginibacter ginsenosidivorans]